MQEQLWYDRPHDALRDLVAGIGGPKAAAALVRSTGNPVDVARTVNHWCDPDRAEKPSLDDLLTLLKAGRQHGCHILLAYINKECGYAPPVPVNPESERDRLHREYINAVNAIKTIARDLQKLEGA